jgi:hypothetical protein
MNVGGLKDDERTSGVKNFVESQPQFHVIWGHWDAAIYLNILGFAMPS